MQAEIYFFYQFLFVIKEQMNKTHRCTKILQMIEDFSPDAQESLCLLITAVEYILQDKENDAKEINITEVSRKNLLPILLKNMEESCESLRKVSLLMLSILIRNPKIKLNFMHQNGMPINSCSFVINKISRETELETCVLLLKQSQGEYSSNHINPLKRNSLFWYVKRNESVLGYFQECDLMFNINGELNLSNIPDPSLFIIGGQLFVNEAADIYENDIFTRFQCDTTSLGDSIIQTKKSYKAQQNACSENFRVIRTSNRSPEKNQPPLMLRRQRPETNDNKFHSILDFSIFKEKDKFNTMKGIKRNVKNLSRDSFRITRPKIESKPANLGSQTSNYSYTISHKRLLTSLFNKTKIKSSIERNL
jgi:hypothetical protein